MPFSVAQYHNNVKRKDAIEYASAAALNAVLGLSMNRALSSAGVGIGTTKSKVRTNATLTYTVNGALLTKNDTDDFWTLSGAPIPPSSFGGFVLAIDSAGAAAVFPLTVSKIAADATLASTNKTSPWAPLLAILNAGYTIVGVVNIATNASTTFTPGTTLLDAAGVTATYTNGVPGAMVLPLIGGPNGALYGLVL